jgi:hypothetical protein
MLGQSKTKSQVRLSRARDEFWMAPLYHQRRVTWRRVKWIYIIIVRLCVHDSSPLKMVLLVCTRPPCFILMPCWNFMNIFLHVIYSQFHCRLLQMWTCSPYIAHHNLGIAFVSPEYKIVIIALIILLSTYGDNARMNNFSPIVDWSPGLLPLEVLIPPHTKREESPEQAIQSVSLLIIGGMGAAVSTKEIGWKIDHTRWTEAVPKKVLATKNRVVTRLTIAVGVAGKGIIWKRTPHITNI